MNLAGVSWNIRPTDATSERKGKKGDQNNDLWHCHSNWTQVQNIGKKMQSSCFSFIRSRVGDTTRGGGTARHTWTDRQHLNSGTKILTSSVFSPSFKCVQADHWPQLYTEEDKTVDLCHTQLCKLWCQQRHIHELTLTMFSVRCISCHHRSSYPWCQTLFWESALIVFVNPCGSSPLTCFIPPLPPGSFPPLFPC